MALLDELICFFSTDLCLLRELLTLFVMLLDTPQGRGRACRDFIDFVSCSLKTFQIGWQRICCFGRVGDLLDACLEFVAIRNDLIECRLQ
ncbi:hypothetical protein Xcaj_23340 [Xanthomonas axonopodis pv. cajani]|uniref:Secreted protein n=1 Tax=Xanthomonas axonopodis pv. cajani TaxID=487827 RepID=A0ABX3MGQ3_9XANT|nr:hypothetical protein Xcaj_23340 [Xanthomonas axonopodis pv. cajani]